MNKTILLIDDDTDMCKLISRYLIRNGYTVAEAYTGKTGIEKFREQPFNMVICDYQLGDKTGNEVLQEIKNINPETVVLIITGFSDIKNAIELIKAGAHDYITKPFVPDELLNVLNSITNNHLSANNNAAEVTKKGYNKYLDTNFLVSRSQAFTAMHPQF